MSRKLNPTYPSEIIMGRIVSTDTIVLYLNNIHDTINELIG